MRDKYIAVFDSGVGGISVLRHLLRQLPGERFLYYGDSANAPYGTRTEAEVKRLTLAAAEKLCSRGIKALVVACNTATGAAIEALREKYPELTVVGVEPALKLAADRYPGGHIGVMATPVTLQSEKFHRLLQRFNRENEVSLLPAPGLVELIEKGQQDSPEAQDLLARIFRPYKGRLDALVLGCTHYPFAAQAIEKVLPGVPLLDGGEGTAVHTRHELEKKGLLRTGEGELIFENSLEDPHILELSRKLAE